MSLFSKLQFWKHDDEFDFEALASQDTTPPKDLLGLDEKSAFPNQPEPLSSEPSFLDQPENTAPPFGQEPIFPGSKRQSAPRFSPEEDIHPLQRGTAAAQKSVDLDLVNSKLDTIKAILNTMEQRLETMERTLGTKKEKLW